mmetsp:Transcript_15883/g.17925  ORF Transcript_15883/g.17925 Transcript_15883/m.17925 type:complete len:203 (-) Transcript_15883:998-1606(-)
MSRLLRVFTRRRTFESDGLSGNIAINSDELSVDQECHICCPECGFEEFSENKRKELEKSMNLAELEARKLKKSLHKLCVSIRDNDNFDWECHQEITRLGELITIASRKGDFLELAECTQDLNQLQRDVKTCNRLAREESRGRRGGIGGFIRRVGSFPDVIRRTFSRKDVDVESGIVVQRKTGVDLNTAIVVLEEDMHGENNE